MQKRKFLGKRISLEELKGFDANLYEPGDYDDDYKVFQIMLNDFICDGFTDNTGRNAYSIEIFLAGDIIKNITRTGHCHMCGGQCSDDDLNRFPQHSHEEEANDLMSSLVV